MIKKMCVLDWVATILVVIGGINWGLVGLFNFNLVSALFGFNIIARIIYILVGLSAVYVLVCAVRCCKKCDAPK